MIRIIALLLLIGHLLGDFYLQSSQLAVDKKKAFHKLLIHCLIYTASIVMVILPVFQWSLFMWGIGISLAHFVIEGGKFVLANRIQYSEKRDALIYLIDQFLHLFIIGVALIGITISKTQISYLSGIEALVDSLNLDIEHLLGWLFILLALIQPCSITIKKVLNPYRPRNEDYQDEGIPSAGALIGVFERLLILVMLYANQFTAIGFVLTAKSIARYNKISENPQFAEYYLLGTLLSSLLIIVHYLVVF